MAKRPISANPDLFKGVKVRIYPNEEQKARIKQISDCYRYVFNKTVNLLFLNYLGISESQYLGMKNDGLSDFQILKKTSDITRGKFIRFEEMCKTIQSIRNSTPWLKEGITTSSARYSICDVYSGYSFFFKHPHINKSPHYKSKKLKKYSFGCRGERIRFKNGMVKIEGISGMMPYDHYDNAYTYGKPYRITITYDGYENYYLSYQIEVFNPIQFLPEEGPIGIDLGLRKLATLSDGTIYPSLDLRRLERRRRRKQSKVSKDRNRRLQKAKQAKTKLENIPLSKREQKRYRDYRKLITHISNKCLTHTHQVTTSIIKRRPSAIVIEDINFQEMIDDFMSHGIDIRFQLLGTFRYQIEYKTRWAGIPLIIADK